ncbi:hypothetical protein ABZ570_25110 [Micromonospora sp. NPDC007271]|uniref:hypothetical protein n=1 Tax=Micromonospora sp. NPDC007271 TaxID=3154587 RepID=UPI0033EE8711
MGTGAGRWLAPLRADSLGVAEQHQRLAPFANDDAPNPGFERLDAKQQGDYLASLSRCSPRVAVDVNFPQSSHELNDKFLDMIASLEREPEVAEVAKQYEPCMRDAAAPASDYEDLITKIQETVGQAAPGEAAPRGAKWEAAVAKERAAAAADAHCRKPIRIIALQNAGPVIQQFATDHATELVQVQKDWDALVVQASQYPEGKTHLR